MRQVFKILLLGLFCTGYVAFNSFSSSISKIDSLQKILKNFKTTGAYSNDTIRVNVLNTIASEYRKTDPEKAKEYANMALLEARKIKYHKGSTKSLNNLGIIFKNEGLYFEALNFHRKALAISQKIEHIKGVSSSLNSIGNIYSNMGNYERAIEYYRRSLDMFELIKDKKGIAATYNNIGLVYDNQGDYDKAMEYYLKSLKIKEELGNKKGIASTYNNLGLIYRSQRNYEKAIEYLLRSLDIRKKLGDKKDISISLNNIGLIYRLNNKPKEALEYYMESLDIRQKLGDKRGIAGSLNNIGNIYADQANYEEAIICYDQSLKIREELRDKFGISSSLLNIGSLYGKQGDNEKHISYLNESIEIAGSIGAKELLKEAYRNLSGIYLKLSDFENAFHYHTLYSAIKDSIFNAVTSRKIAELQIIYQDEKRQKEIEILTKDKQIQEEQLNKQRIIGYSLLGILGLSLALAYVLYNRFKIERKAKVEIDRQKAEVQIQKELVEEKNKDIIDSITYAQTIQQAILTPLEEIYETIPNAFIVYLPKDIVSGDFYWFSPPLSPQRREISSPGPSLAGGGKEGYGYETADPALYETLQEKAKQMRKQPTEGERILWELLRSGKIGAHFRRQHIIDRFIVDFVCLEKRLVVEADGDIHDYQKEEDELRTSILNDKGFKVIRFKNEEVIVNPDSVIAQIEENLAGAKIHPSGGHRGAVIIAACDCTGHGVPGAFMSLIGNELLNKIVIEQGITQPAAILNRLHEGMKDALHKSQDNFVQNNGMDIALCSLDFAKNELQYAGAYRPLYLFQNKEMKIIKGDKISIGSTTENKEEYTNHDGKMNKGDTAYFFSDGWADQFGGERDKKYSTKRVKNFLMSIQNRGMQEQAKLLETEINQWRGDNTQTDDILVIGVRF
ncbi:tetratricopeptide repeat protein [Candidatus Amoebophilus asiaticus]|nr:tetratricopeptide repeat protein [Candidatus Amoebophilus asiaticus]